MNTNDIAKEHLEKARNKLSDYKYNAAYDEFKKALRLRFRYAEGHSAYASALVKGERYHDATQQFKSAIESDPTIEVSTDDLAKALDHVPQQARYISELHALVDEKDIAVLYNRWGEVLVRVKKFDKAIEYFLKCLRKDPDYFQNCIDKNPTKKTNAMHVISEALKGSRSTSLKIETFQTDVDALNNSHASFTWGLVLLDLGQYDKATDQFQKALDNGESSASLFYYWGQALEKVGDFAGAADKYSESRNLDPSIEDAYLGQGRSLVALEKHSEAIQVYVLAMEKKPSEAIKSDWKKAILGMVNPKNAAIDYLKYCNKKGIYPGYFQQGSATYALDIELLLKNPKLYLKNKNMINSFLKDRQLIEILKEIEDPVEIATTLRNKIKRLKSARLDLLLQWVIVLEEAGHSKEAIKQLGLALELVASDPQIYAQFRNGLYYYLWNTNDPSTRQKVIDDCIHYLEKISNPAFYIDFADLIIEFGEFPRAYSLYDKARENNSSASLTIHSINAIKPGLRWSADPVQAFEDAQYLVDSFSGPDIGLAWGKILEERGDDKSALLQYKQYRSAKPDDPQAYHVLGNAYLASGHYKQACKQFLQGSDLNRDSYEYQFQWGEALLKDQRRDEALKKFIRAIELDESAFEKLEEVMDRLQWDQATLAKFQAAVDQRNNSKTYRQWGGILYRLEKFSLAIGQYKKAVKLDPDPDRFAWNPFIEQYNPYLDWAKALLKGKRQKNKAHEEAITEKDIQDYERTLEHYRKNAQAYIDWAKLLYRLNEYKKSDEVCLLALEKDCKATEALLYRIFNKNAMNEYKQAHDLAKKLLETDSYASHAYFNIGLFHEMKQDYPEAVQQYELAIEKESRSFIIARLSWLLYRMGEFDLACEKMEQYIQTNPKDHNPYYNYGNLLSELNRFDGAEIQFRKSLDQKPDYPYALHNIAWIPYSQGRYEDAWKGWQDTRQVYDDLRSPLVRALDQGEWVDSSEPYNYATIVASLYYELDTAIQILVDGLSFAPEDTSILYGLAEVYWEKKNEILEDDPENVKEKSRCYWEAMRYFHKAENLLKQKLNNFRDLHTLLNLGNLYLTMEKYEKAQECFEEAQKLDKKNPVPYGTPSARLGVTFLRRKNPQEAIPHLLEAYKLNPNSLDLQSNLAEAYLQTERLDEAQKAYKAILQISPCHVSALIGMGEVCIALGEKSEPDQFKQAITHFGRALEVAKKKDIRSKYLTKQEKAEIHYSLGYARVQLYENSGLQGDVKQLDKALKDFQRCREIDPGHAKSARAIEKIKERRKPFSQQKLAEQLGPLSVFFMSASIFIVVQLIFFVIPLINPHVLTFREGTFSGMADLLPDQTEAGLEALEGQHFDNQDELLQALQPLLNSDQRDELGSTILDQVIQVRKMEFYPQIEVGYYVLLTFGSILFMITGLYLPQVLKLRVAGIELEKSSVDQSQIGSSLGISK